MWDMQMLVGYHRNRKRGVFGNITSEKVQNIRTNDFFYFFR